MKHIIKSLLFVLIGSVTLQAQEKSLTEAEKLLREKKTQEAKRVIAEYLTKNEMASSYVHVGHLYARLRMWSDSVHYLSLASTRAPKSAGIWYDLALAQHQNKKIDEAVNSLRESIKLNPKNKNAVLSLGEILELSQNRYEARHVYVSGLKALKEDADIRSKLCWVNYQDAFFAETIKQCTAAVKLNPKNDFSWALLGRMHSLKEERTKAFEVFKTGLQHNPNSNFIRRARGLVYFDEKSFEQAALDLGKAFGLDRYDDEAGLYLARTLFELGHYEQALPVFTEVCLLNRTHRFEFLSKQRELERGGKNKVAALYQEALEDF